MRGASSILLITILLFQFTSCLLSFSTIAGPFTQVTIDPPSQDVEVDVSPGSNGVASAQITVACQTIDPTPVMVTLSAESPGALVGLSPNSMVFQTLGTSSIDVTVDIIVPIQSTSSDMICSITGTWQQGLFSGEVAPATIKIIVLPYYRFELSCKSPLNETCQGEGACFNLSIENTGNCRDDYELKITNQKELEADNISIPKTDTISIGKGEVMKIEMEVKTSLTTPIRNYTLHLTVTSLGSKAESKTEVYEVLPLFLTVKKGMHNETRASEKELDLLLNPITLILTALIAILNIAFIIKRRRSARRYYPPT
ncbi:MAG: hypothetical protein JSW00_17510 [Thermoplasmata archaeon]|nr:MAG: hypothetical protein JSW00_17510 [Thermoplasmata archaeon]